MDYIIAIGLYKSLRLSLEANNILDFIGDKII